MGASIKHIIFLLVIVALGAGTYYLVQDGTLLKKHVRRAEDVQRETETLKREIIVPLQRLQSVDIDKSFFASQEYKALDDKSVPLSEPEVNRNNPFATIGQ